MFSFIFRTSNLALYHKLFHLIFNYVFILLYTLIYLIFTVILCGCLLLVNKDNLKIQYEKKVS